MSLVTRRPMTLASVFCLLSTLAAVRARRYASNELDAGLSGISTNQLLGWSLFGVGCIAALAFAWPNIDPIARFAYSCFFQPLGKAKDQQTRLDRFYQAQATIYDKTRGKLLRGRHTMLRLSAAQVLEQRRRHPKKRLVWVDIGGGTGWNIEQMAQYLPLDTFDAIYLIDLCEPLLEVARKRFAAKGWENVHVLRQDATAFTLPEWTAPDSPSDRTIDLVTLSYAYSMIPNYYALSDRIDQFLNHDGVIAVCDFYVSGREASPLSQAVGAVGRQCSWLSRFFWYHWFEFDHVDLHPSRRQYLEFRFGTLKSYNGRNQFFLTRIPYYVWVGFKAETTPLQYLIDTLDPVAEQTHLRDANYHYYLCLQQRYSPSCPPLYLSRDGFEAMKRDGGRLTDSFRLHTDSIKNVLLQLEPASLTVWVGMDHMDWFVEPPKVTPTKEDACELTSAIRALHRALATGGRAFWRSAAMRPWYAAVFQREGFAVECLSVRKVGTKQPIDRVNMYASFWKAVKL